MTDMREVTFLQDLHGSTRRDYLARMNDSKVECMDRAREFSFDYWDGNRRFGYGGYKYLPNRWQPVVTGLTEVLGLGQDSKVLDLGCGKGALLRDIRRTFERAELVGLDVSEYALGFIPQDERIETVRHDLRAPLPFRNDEFDLVISLGTLHNLELPEVEITLSEMQRVAKVSYLMVESYRSTLELFNLQCWALTAETFFRPREWEFLLRRCGFSGAYEFIYF